MSERNEAERSDVGAPASNTESDEVQAELRRESAEGKGAIGDLSSNRNLSGSSTWETLPDASESGEQPGTSN